MEKTVIDNTKETLGKRIKVTALSILRRGGVYLALILLFVISAILSPIKSQP